MPENENTPPFEFALSADDAALVELANMQSTRVAKQTTHYQEEMQSALNQLDITELATD